MTLSRPGVRWPPGDDNDDGRRTGRAAQRYNAYAACYYFPRRRGERLLHARVFSYVCENINKRHCDFVWAHGALPTRVQKQSATKYRNIEINLVVAPRSFGSRIFITNRNATFECLPFGPGRIIFSGFAAKDLFVGTTGYNCRGNGRSWHHIAALRVI